MDVNIVDKVVRGVKGVSSVGVGGSLGWGIDSNVGSVLDIFDEMTFGIGD